MRASCASTAPRMRRSCHTRTNSRAPSTVFSMAAERPSTPSDPALPDPRAVRRAFARAAQTYDSAAVLQREVGARMIERLDVVKLEPAAILDAGCGTGDALGELATRYPHAARVALDVAMPMLVAARAKTTGHRSVFARLAAGWRGATIARAPSFVCADVGALPFAAASFELVWSNLTLQWVADLPRALAEMHRVLAVGGLLTHTGFADPVMQMDAITMTYAEPIALLRDLKSIGATNAATGRARGMLGRTRFNRVITALASLTRDGRIPATFEVVYGHAWKAQRTRTPEGHAIVRIERGHGGVS